MLIYKITNIINGKLYIGQHVGDDLQKYLRCNIVAAIRGVKGKVHLYNAIRKYGPEAFIIEHLVSAKTKEELDAAEIYLIMTHESRNPEIGYNITAGGEGTLGVKRPNLSGKTHPMYGKKCPWTAERNRQRTGYKHSDETRSKMSKAHIGKKCPEHSERMYGKQHSEETKRKMSLAHKGRVFSEEHRNNLSKAQKNKCRKKL